MICFCFWCLLNLESSNSPSASRALRILPPLVLRAFPLLFSWLISSPPTHHSPRGCSSPGIVLESVPRSRLPWETGWECASPWKNLGNQEEGWHSGDWEPKMPDPGRPRTEQSTLLLFRFQNQQRVMLSAGVSVGPSFLSC